MMICVVNFDAVHNTVSAQSTLLTVPPSHYGADYDGAAFGRPAPSALQLTWPAQQKNELDFF